MTEASPARRRLFATCALAAVAAVVPALPAHAAPTFVGVLADRSVAATYPSGIEYDDVQGRLVVGKNRLLQLTDNGNGTATITRTIASVTAPRGVAVDANGNVYASTQGNVIKVTPGGVRTTLAATGGGNTQVRSPYGLRIVGSGTSAQLLIADRGNDRVLVLTLAGAYVTQFGTSGSGNGQLSFPQGVDRHPTTGAIAVADFANDRVSVWAPS